MANFFKMLQNSEPLWPSMSRSRLFLLCQHICDETKKQLCQFYTTKYPHICFRNDEILYNIYPVHIPESRRNFFTNITRVIIRGRYADGTGSQFVRNTLITIYMAVFGKKTDLYNREKRS